MASSKKRIKVKKTILIKKVQQHQNSGFNQQCSIQLQKSIQLDLSIEAPPSLKPSKRYCDVTGFEAKYKDPLTQLFYCDSIVFNYIRNCPKATAETYLNIRGCTQKLIA